ncbi:c-type cytochrome [Pseudorhodoplanes sp.]|uniref:c-type cytochrome n=1 Tax=Pseudorhodoplanes sp. TaxID=1934341 RepID=UPI00391C9863
MKMMRLALAAAALAATTGIDNASAQDAAAGETVFKKCMTCHRIGEGAKNAVGPQQNGIVGRRAGSVEGFAYSPLNKAAGEAGLVWTEENIFNYLPDPQGFLIKFLKDAGKPELAKGTTKMAFKLPNEKERKDVIAYLKKFSPSN